MRSFRPFELIVPAWDKPHLVASRSYLSYGKAELQDKLDRNPYSFLHVINPAGTKAAKAKRGSEGFFALVRNRFEEFVADGLLQRLEGNHIAIYRQTTPTSSCTGVVGTLAVESIRSGRLKVHEQTLQKRERLFAKYLNTVGCHAEPILCMFPDQDAPGRATQQCIDSWIQNHSPEIDFSTTDRIRHTVWIVGEIASLEISDAMENVSSMYLADGHHRVASSLILSEKFPHDSAKQHVLTFAVPESELVVRGYHREIIGMPWSPEEWDEAFRRMTEIDHVQRIPNHASPPSDVGIVHVHHAQANWVLHLKEPTDQLGRMEVDAAQLQRTFFEPELNIKDPRNDKRLAYIPGTLNSADLRARVMKQPDSVVFELHPVPTRLIKETADRGGYLPPKSTWVEPKLRSGLFIHDIQ